LNSPSKRNPRKIDLHHDIDGTTESPDVTLTILNKIAESDVVVADVPLAGSTPDYSDSKGDTFLGKKPINAIVAIELD
jgi:hypothetical protein